jgi:hypothetical protein
VSRAIVWLRRRPIESWVTLALVAGSVLFIWEALLPRLLLADTTANGGDLGAHVWAPAFLRDHLLPHWRLSGWTPDWYAGFPAYQFYMVVPGLAVVALDAVGVSYNVAFKLVSVSGLLALPVCAWGMARLARQRFPVPAACAVATLAFVFDRSFTIYGGNALSTLAGEFAFTISLCFALLFLGAVARLLDTGRGRALAAVLFALCVTCHLIPAVFALLGAGALTVVSWWGRRGEPAAAPAAGDATPVVVPGEEAAVAGGGVPLASPTPVERAGEPAPGTATPGRVRSLGRVVVAVAVGGLLTSFWTVPFVLRRAYMTDMGWQKVTTYLEVLFPGRIGRALTDLVGRVGGSGGGATAHVPGDSAWVVAFALVGVIAAVGFRRRFGTSLAVLAGVLALAVRLAPQGRLWNARLLPFWYLCLYLLAALAVAEILAAASQLVRPDQDAERARRLAVAAATVGGSLAVLVAVALPLRMLPFGTSSPDGRTYSWFGLSTSDQSLVRSWARWDYSGYERKPAYPEYRALVTTMADVGSRLGCGRAMWEYDASLDRFGTPMALMLLPYWTDECIGSMEGLYFEASATTPYHFLNQSELSAAPSRAQRDLAYGPLDVHLGVQHLQMLGVRYYIAFSKAAVQQADAEPALTPVATSGTFHVYEVAGSSLVEGLAYQPAVVRDAPEGGAAWQQLATSWYLDPSRQDVYLAADGPAGWSRVTQASAARAADDRRALPAVAVTDVTSDDDTIAFTVDRPGVPVVVKTSYFPNWQAHGAEGPYRVAPNLMVVVPTSTHVRLVYGRTGVDWLGYGLTGVGAVALAALVLVGRRRRGSEAGPGAGRTPGGEGLALAPPSGPAVTVTVAGEPVDETQVDETPVDGGPVGDGDRPPAGEPVT